MWIGLRKHKKIHTQFLNPNTAIMKNILVLIFVLASNFICGQTGDSIGIYACENVFNGEVITTKMKEPGCYLTFTDSTMIWHAPPGGEDMIYTIKKKVSKDYFLVTDGIEEYVINIYVLDSRATAYDFLTGERIDYYTCITFKQYGQVTDRYYCSPIYHKW